MRHHQLLTENNNPVLHLLQDVVWIGNNCEAMVENSTLELLGDNAICSQSGQRTLLIQLGQNAAFEPGGVGALSQSISLEYPMPIGSLEFIAVVSAELNTEFATEDWSIGSILGPGEIGPCDPIVIRVVISSARLLNFVWDCPACPESSPLTLSLSQQIHNFVVIAPEDLNDHADYQSVTIRVRLSHSSFSSPKNIQQLTHTIQKLPFPIPVFSASGPPFAVASAFIALRADGHLSSCERLNPDLKTGTQLNFTWSSASWAFPILDRPPVTSLSPRLFSESYEVQVLSTSDPQAIATSTVTIVRIPSYLSILLQSQGQYNISASLFQDGLEADINALGANFTWTCSKDRQDCFTSSGSRITLDSSAANIRLQPQYFQPGEMYSNLQQMIALSIPELETLLLTN